MLLRFLSSTFVPSFVVPTGFTLTFASQRICPFSMSQSEIPAFCSVLRSDVRKAKASSGENRSGSVTISIKGAPARL
ncbi:MAG: hypothetical protein BWY82_00804 [Verrucomicrobia bacterium ADurb.Bin474]|nr:MAG: hypothetical protein BWY82_00804 [Verrucomicrobia bacterium ADurb.Bin474]